MPHKPGPNPPHAPQSCDCYIDGLKKIIQIILNTELADDKNWNVCTGYSSSYTKEIDPNQIQLIDNLMLLVSEYPNRVVPLCNIQWIEFFIKSDDKNIDKFNDILIQTLPPQLFCKSSKCCCSADLVNYYGFYQKIYPNITIPFNIYPIAPYSEGKIDGRAITNDCQVAVFQTNYVTDGYIHYVLLPLSRIAFVDIVLG